MKVTYSDSVGNGFVLSTLSSRALTQNLMDNDRFDHSFSPAILTIPPKVLKYLKSTILNVEKRGKERYLESSYMKFLKHVIAQRYSDDLLNTIKGDYLFYSMSQFDFTIISKILNAGVRVVAGGCEVNMNSFEDTRKKFVLWGTKEKNLKNLLLIKGTITPRTELYNIVKSWKDTCIPNERLEDIYLAKNDYLRTKPMLRIKKIVDKHIDSDVFKEYVWPNGVLSIIFSSKCLWGKCRFCMYNVLDDIDFIKNLSAEEIIDAVWETCRNTNCYTIFFADDYLYFNKKREKVISTLVDRGCRFICQSGIKLLANERYAEKAMKYFYMFSIGLESASDFTLKQFNKGITWKDIQKAHENLKKYYNNNTFTTNIIVDGPVESIEDANLNYRRLLDLKQDLESHNMKVIHTISILAIDNEKMMSEFEALGHIKRAEQGKELSGKVRLVKELQKYVDLPYGWAEHNDLPYERIDKYGNILDSDFEIVDEDIMRKLTDQTFFYQLRNKEIENNKKNDKKI
jgi:hypothetical protein